MPGRIDFTNCRRLPGKAYNGANGKKIAVEYQGVPYMLKFPPSAAKKKTELLYTNSCVSEHIGSSIFNMLGIPAQQTMLGTFEVNGKQKVVCACRDFTVGNVRFHDFCSIKNTVIDSGHDGNGTELDDLLEAIEKQGFMSPLRLLERFWDMFVADALLGNFDRHNGNWGFVYDESTLTTDVAPVFDCGSCLLPQADERTMESVLKNEDELNARIYQFPTSAIQRGGRKINYYDFLTGAENRDCGAAVLRIVPRVQLSAISAFVSDVPYISEKQKEFYTKYIAARFEKILIPAYEAAMAQQPHEPEAGPSMTM